MSSDPGHLGFCKGPQRSTVSNTAAISGISVVDKKPTKLVVVCCHGIWKGPLPSEDNWLIQSFQEGETECFVRHIKKGLEVLTEMDGEGILIFSGGRTRKESRLSEGESYYNLAKLSYFYSYFEDEKYKQHPELIFIENRAMDSFQNIVFSLISFDHLYGSFPEQLVVVSHEFKRARFEQLHFMAIRKLVFQTDSNGIQTKWQGIPRFEGIDPAHMISEPSSKRAMATRKSEKEAFDLWRETPQGNSGVLLEKRMQRNVWNSNLDYRLSRGWVNVVSCGECCLEK